MILLFRNLLIGILCATQLTKTPETQSDLDKYREVIELVTFLSQAFCLVYLEWNIVIISSIFKLRRCVVSTMRVSHSLE